MVYFRANGVVLRAELRGRGEPVVLVPDIGEDLTSWGFQAPAFGGRHFLIRFDNRCSGWSECPESCSVDDMAGDVLSLMDQLGVDRAHLVGLGLGGMVALEVALRRSGRVNGLVLASTSASATPEQELVLGSWIDAARVGEDPRRVALAMLPWLHSPRFLEDERWRDYLARARTTGYRSASWEGAARQLDAMRRFRSEERLSGIRAPTLVISGSEDLLVPPRCTERLASGIEGSEVATLSAGHLLQVEAPKMFNQVVLDFLARVEGALGREAAADDRPREIEPTHGSQNRHLFK